tara:strand:+ start:127 stop:648 length:522 start_codon:yes stop_codon:yes gene_type:complete
MTGIFKINNNEVFGSDGTFSGTIGNASFPSGHIVQMQHFSINAETSTNSTTFVATALTDQITITDASNKVIIIANVAGALKTGANYISAYTIYRGTTNLASGGSDTVSAYDWMGFLKSGDSNEAGTNINMCFVDTPGAGTHTYTVYYGSNDGSNAYFCVWNQTSQIILMEVTA